ncbi:family 16 glycoside hydrolase [Singulisphaera rosea]
MGVPEAHRHVAAKVVGGIFAAVIAPIVAGVGVNVIQKKLEDKAEPEKVATSPANANAKEELDPRAALKVSEPLHPSVLPGSLGTKEAPLAFAFNGKDLAGFRTYLGIPLGEEEPLGLDNDPKHVFSVPRNGEHKGHLRISGEVNGALETEKEYENYHLTAEYQWGELRWAPRENEERLSGFTLHSTGAEGSSHKAWRPGFRCRILAEQGAGDLIPFPTMTNKLSVAVEAEVVKGFVTKKSTSNEKAHEGSNSEKSSRAKHAKHEHESKEHEAHNKVEILRYFYNPGFPLTTVTTNTVIHHLGAPRTIPQPGHSTQPLDTRWHTVECLCFEDKLTIRWDGKTVLEASKLSQSRGKIQIISDGAEIFFRRVELKPLVKPAS